MSLLQVTSMLHGRQVGGMPASLAMRLVGRLPALSHLGQTLELTGGFQRGRDW